MVSKAGGVIIAIILLVAAAAAWVVFTHLRARRLGLPPPTLSSYLFWRQSDNPYGPPRPAPSGITGWVNDQVRKFKNRNNRSATGAYEQNLPGDTGGRGRHGFGPLDPDEAWDARVGNEADGYGLYEEQELSGSVPAHSTEYGGGTSYDMNLAAPSGAEYRQAERGRSATRSPKGTQLGHTNPFDDDVAASLRGVSPRPMDTPVMQKSRPSADHDSNHSNHGDRRAVLRENV